MNKIYRVLEIGMTRNIGGMETYLIEQYRHLDKSKIQYDFVNLTGEYPMAFEKEIISNGNRVYNIVSRGKNPLKHYYEWFQFMRKYHKLYDAIILNTCDLYHIIPLFLAKIFGIKTIILHSHNAGNEKSKNRLRKILIRFNTILMNFSVTNYWACSKVAAEWMFGYDKKYELIKNGIDTHKYIYNEKKRYTLRKEMYLDEHFVIGHIGRFAYQKNHEFIIKLFYEIIKAKPNAILLLIGKIEQTNQIFINTKNLVKQLGLEDKVLFLNARNDVADLYQIMDCFILPSHFEGLPIVGIEAQAAGLKCVVSKNISRELQITNLVKFIGLNENIKLWVKEILSAETLKRENMYEKIISTGYDIKKENVEVQNRLIKIIKYNYGVS